MIIEHGFPLEDIDVLISHTRKSGYVELVLETGRMTSWLRAKSKAYE